MAAHPKVRRVVSLGGVVIVQLDQPDREPEVLAPTAAPKQRVPDFLATLPIWTAR